MYSILYHKNNNIIFSFYVLTVSFLMKKSINYIVLPFKKTNIPFNISNETIDNPIEDFLSKININKIYTQISFGAPSKSIDFYFSMNEYITSINLNSCLKYSKSSYTPLSSKKYKNIQKEKNSILSNEKCSIYKDLDLTENITFNTFEFFLINNSSKQKNNILIEKNKYCGEIGLRRFSDNSILDKESFIYNLKKNNIINSYSWGIFFFNPENLNKIDDDTQGKYDGFFIAGIISDDNIDIFDSNFVCTIYAEEDSLYWTLNFDRIFYYEKINDTIDYISTNNTRVELIIDLNYIICDEYYYKDIKTIYFKKFFDNNTCHEEILFKEGEGYTHMIICELSFRNYQKSFPSIYFYSEQLCFAFNLNHDDVFFEYKNKIYFLVAYKDSIKNYWKLGNIFLKKYPFVFDYDKKIISYVHLKKVWSPKKNNTKDKIKNKNNNNKIFKNFKEYSLIVLLVIGIFIGLFIGKRIWNKNNKLKANELEENYKHIVNENNKIDKLY